MNVLTVSGWIASFSDSSLPGRTRSNFFFSSPIREVQSMLPHPFPFPSFFSHTLKVTPQLQIACVSFLKRTPFGCPFFLTKSSLSSHFIASSMRLASKTSVILRRRCSSSRICGQDGCSLGGFQHSHTLGFWHIL